MGKTTPSNRTSTARNSTPAKAARSRRRTSQFLDLEPEVDGSEDSDNQFELEEPSSKRPRKINVKQLKAALQNRGLSTTGLKAQLLARFLQADQPAEPPVAAEAAGLAAATGKPQSDAAADANGFDINAFLAATSAAAKPPAADGAAAATPSRYDATNLTMVGFSIDTSGVVKLLDAAFPTEFKNRSGKEFPSTRKAAGLHFVAGALPPT